MYLREASASAIRWQAWSPDTLALARSLNRPILIDIGAVWCHWCHVMDATTYADPQVAAALNSEFVPVKVDTDERPDLDEYYQNAAAQLTGAGGWPLTCFTTPDGALFFAAGYLPPRPGSGPNGSGGENSSMLPLLEANLASVRDGSRGTRTRGRGNCGEAQIHAEPERIGTREDSRVCARKYSRGWRRRTIASREDSHRAKGRDFTISRRSNSLSRTASTGIRSSPRWRSTR